MNVFEEILSRLSSKVRARSLFSDIAVEDMKKIINRITAIMDEKIQLSIRKQALDAGLSPSDQIRDILGLPINKRPKRPRLTVSLALSDYQLLAEKYGLEAIQQLDIKRKLMDELIESVNLSENK